MVYLARERKKIRVPSMNSSSLLSYEEGREEELRGGEKQELEVVQAISCVSPHTLRCSSSVLVTMVMMEYCLRVCSHAAMSGRVCTISFRRYTATVSGWRSMVQSAKCKVKATPVNLSIYTGDLQSSTNNVCVYVHVGAVIGRVNFGKGLVHSAIK